MARTRSKPAKAAPKESTPEPTTTAKPLPASTSNPPKLFVLPKDTSKDARIVTLDNPANETPSRYYFCPQKGFYEFTRIAAPKKDFKSWLITGEKSEDDTTEEADTSRIGSGHITKSADLFIATPIDILFLILPALTPKSAKDTKQHFLAFDDYLDTLSSSSPHWKTLLSQYPTLKTMTETKMRRICDTVDAGEESMYRLSHPKLLEVLLAKAERMVKKGLPPSMEEKFIKTALEIPVMSIKREESTLSAISTTPDDTSERENSTAVNSQTSITTTITTPDDAPSKPTLTTPTEIPHLLRLRTSLTYLLASYTPPSLRAPLLGLLSARFIPLDTHLSAIAALKSEALSLRSISDNISRKRAIEEDEEKIAEREEKKRKKEDEERKKKSEGRGVKALKKVDTSGMKKMSSFFSVKPKGK
ncbi:ribonuclease H2, subunit B [Alternaria rosae]|uniref:ribonuclease H2, subunit B n=1 Tax=Alternaria rosae TaxID=1187941 RepID=UPI001E8E5F6D|nr:ribonuclease H2, subunit B [Alternaria rosae]KAH6858927.1 ribonuclease H2, subunit B [Alternaria rosae]